MKNTAIFMQNKANLSVDKFGAKHFSTRIYERFHPLVGRKNKPNQTQYKANSNPILQRQKMNIRNAITMNYKDFIPLAAHKNKAKTKPKQTQSSLSSNVVVGGPISKAGKRLKEAKKKKRASGTFLRLWVAGKIDFLDGCDIILGKTYGKTQFNFLWRLIS